MSRRLLLRVAAVLAAVAAPLLTTAVASADPPLPPLPGLPPLPSPPPVPEPGIQVVIPVPSLATFTATVPDGTCIFIDSYDNTSLTPPGSRFRGQTTCGSGVYQPAISGQAVLKDPLGNVVGVAPAYSQIGGLGTSEGFLASAVVGTGSTDGVVPGLEYTVEYDSSVTLTSFQTWGAPGTGCTINGQTEYCVVTAPFLYLPGTKGGVTPA